MTTPSLSSSPFGANDPTQVPIQSPPTVDVPPADGTDVPSDAWTPQWGDRLTTTLWQLGLSPDEVRSAIVHIRVARLEEPQLEQLFAVLAREVALRHASDAFEQGADIGQVPQGPVQQGPVQQSPVQQWPVQQGPPTMPPPDVEVPPGTGEPTTPPPTDIEPPSDPDVRPTKPTDPSDPVDPTDPTDPPEPPSGGEKGLSPWLIGAGIVGAGLLAVGGVMAYRNGAANVRALKATATSFNAGSLNQGTLQSIKDAQLGARFVSGIGTREYLSVALPGINRIGVGGKLASVARGHANHTEMIAAATALRRGAGDAVAVHEPLRNLVREGLQGGRSMGSILDDLDRSAAGVKPMFDNKQLARYWDQGSVLRGAGRGSGGSQILSSVTEARPTLAIGASDLVETGATSRINRLVTSSNAQLGGRGLAEGLGHTQGLNVSTLHPAMQETAMRTAGVSLDLAEQVGLPGAFTARWTERLAQGAASATP